MRDFHLFQATSVAEAVSVLDQYGGSAKIIAGGTDLLSLNKNLANLRTNSAPNPDQTTNDNKAHLPDVMVDITSIPNLDYIRADSGGLRIGALAKISGMANDTNVNSNFNVLVQAANQAASPQIRNMATVVGDVLQETWCWYLRYDYNCWRNGGNVCYGAIGDNRYYHSIFGGRLCYATQQSDIAPALLGLDAQVTIQSPSGQKTVTIDQLLPGITMVNGQVKADILNYNEMVTEIFVPNKFSGARGNFTKIRMRPSWDFALASAAVVKSSNDARIVMGGVDVRPRRFTAGEDMLRGQTVTQGLANKIADAAVADAVPLAMNDFRVGMARTAVQRAVMAVA